MLCNSLFGNELQSMCYFFADKKTSLHILLALYNKAKLKPPKNRNKAKLKSSFSFGKAKTEAPVLQTDFAVLKGKNPPYTLAASTKQSRQA